MDLTTSHHLFILMTGFLMITRILHNIAQPHITRLALAAERRYAQTSNSDFVMFTSSMDQDQDLLFPLKNKFYMSHIYVFLNLHVIPKDIHSL
jgi:hypothetical protein